MATFTHSTKTNTVSHQYVCGLYHNTVIRHSMEPTPLGQRGREEGRTGGDSMETKLRVWMASGELCIQV